VRINNDPYAFRSVLEDAGEHPAVVLEATYGWYWAAICWPSWAPKSI
jgi:hypothetical protein